MVTLNWKYLTVAATAGRTEAGVLAGSHQRTTKVWTKMYAFLWNQCSHSWRQSTCAQCFCVEFSFGELWWPQYAKKRLSDCLKAIFLTFRNRKSNNHAHFTQCLIALQLFWSHHEGLPGETPAKAVPWQHNYCTALRLQRPTKDRVLGVTFKHTVTFAQEFAPLNNSKLFLQCRLTVLAFDGTVPLAIIFAVAPSSSIQLLLNTKQHQQSVFQWIKQATHKRAHCLMLVSTSTSSWTEDNRFVLPTLLQFLLAANKCWLCHGNAPFKSTCETFSRECLQTCSTLEKAFNESVQCSAFTPEFTLTEHTWR